MRRIAVAVLFVTALVGVLIGGHWYLARRLVLDPALPEPARSVLLVLLLALAGSLVLQPLAERLAAPRLVGALSWTASLWMGFAFLLLVLVAASDALALLLGALAVADADAVALARVRALGVVLVALLAGAAGVRAARRPPAVRRVELRLRRWPAGLDGYRIVQVSDVHIGPLLDRRFAAEVVARCNALAPDLVALTGDLVDGSVRQLRDEVAPFGGLRARDGVWFVTGNHDYYSGAEDWVAEVERLGMRALRNARVTIRRGEDAFDLAGVEDHHAHLVSRRWREDVPGAFGGRDPVRAVVLLAHDPGTFTVASRLGVDLQLSGHTHGGQIWPFGWLVRLAVPWVAGLHQRNGSWLYVSRGTGFWGPAMRLRAPAEITELVLRGA